MESDVREYIQKRIEIEIKPKQRRCRLNEIKKPFPNRHLSLEEKKIIIEKKYGVYGAPSNRIVMNNKEICCEIGVRLQIVQRICKQYKDNNDKLPDNVQRNTNLVKIKGEDAEYLLRKDTLEAWKTKTITQRCFILEDERQLSITSHCLKDFYKKNGIRYLTPCYRTWVRATNEDHLKHQQEFVYDLVQDIMDGKEIVYIDESSLNLWQHNAKAWFSHKDPMIFQLCSNRGSNVSMIGAISTERTERLFFEVVPTTNNETVFPFLKRLSREFEEPQNVTIVMDNLRCHRHPPAVEYLTNMGIKLLYLPPSSCNLNPIERIWSTFKHHFTRELFEAKGRIKEDEAPDRIRRVVK